MSIWAFRCSSVAYRWRMSLTVMSISAAESFSWESWDLPPVASHRYCGMRAEHIMAVFSDSTRGMGLSGCCGRHFFNLVNSVDRISTDKISATVLRKFVNGVYDIVRDVKI